MGELEPVAANDEQAQAGNIETWHSAHPRGERETDETILRRLIEDHFRHTGSFRSRDILGDWEHARTTFVKVIPTDYRRAMEIGRASCWKECGSTCKSRWAPVHSKTIHLIIR